MNLVSASSDFAQPPPFEVIEPASQTMPVVFASPHSGQAYAAEDLALSRLALSLLRRSEDAFVDELFAAAPACGAPLMRAHYPRVFLDVNREPFELDPGMFAGPLPRAVNSRSSRVAAGLGTIAKINASGETIYGHRLPVEEATRRIKSVWEPYHRTLAALIGETKAAFGAALLIDCHSMPSIGGPIERDASLRRVDFVLGDCFGRSCAPGVTDAVEAWLRGLGYVVARNAPYAGGYTTQHYGKPAKGSHVLQIEINRRLYMDEWRIERGRGFGTLAEALSRFVAALGGIARGALRLT